MANNMTIGPAVIVGGNEVQMTTKGKIQVTNPKGKVVTLSQDQFQKQTLKNIDKLQNGEDFEYKKDRKGLKIAGAVAGTAVVATGIIYRKEIGRYMKNFSFKKAWNDFKNLFRKSTKEPQSTRTVFDKEKAGFSEETLRLKQEALAEDAKSRVNAFEARMKELEENHSKTQMELNKKLGLKKGEKDTLEIIPRRYIREDGTVVKTKKERNAIDRAIEATEANRKADIERFKSAEEARKTAKK